MGARTKQIYNSGFQGWSLKVQPPEKQWFGIPVSQWIFLPWISTWLPKICNLKLRKACEICVRVYARLKEKGAIHCSIYLFTMFFPNFFLWIVNPCIYTLGMVNEQVMMNEMISFSRSELCSSFPRLVVFLISYAYFQIMMVMHGFFFLCIDHVLWC